MTTLRLKADHTFSERSVCFGVMKVSGSYRFRNDTIFFEKVRPGRYAEKHYSFGVIRPSSFNKDGKYFDLVRYGHAADTVGHVLWVQKNGLAALKQ